MLLQVAQLGSGVITARIFTPGDFGVVALALVFIGAAALISDSGLGVALVQRRSVTAVDQDTVFWLCATLSASFGLLLALASPLLADALGEPQLTLLLPIGALAFLLNVAAVPVSILERELRFGVVATVDLVAGAVGIAVGVTASILTRDLVCLVLPSIVTTALRSLLYLRISRWRPSWRFSRESARSVLGFSVFFSASNLVYYARINTDNLLVGTTAGRTALGFYARAYMLMSIPVTIVPEILGRVLLPAMAARRRSGQPFDRLYQGTHLIVGIATAVVLGSLAVVAEPLIVFVYGAPWREAATLLPILCLAGAIQGFLSPCAWFYVVIEQTRSQFLWSLFATATTVTGIVVGAHWGASGVAWSLVATNFLLLSIYLPLTQRRLVATGGERSFSAPTVLLAIALTGGAMVAAASLVASTPATMALQTTALVGGCSALALRFRRAILSLPQERAA